MSFDDLVLGGGPAGWCLRPAAEAAAAA